MKYLRGFLAAGIFGAITFVLKAYAERFSTLVDMVYPYVARTLQNGLAQWSSQVDFCIWQVLAVLLGILVLASIVVMLICKWNFVQWLGWVLAVASGIYMLHTAVWGLNYYAGNLADDMRLTVSAYTLEELTEATTYYRDNANALASAVRRDTEGNVAFDSFEALAAKAGAGFEYLTRERCYPVFAGSTVPVKKLGWADMYASMGITGYTFGLTGEAAVNPEAPPVSLPFTMCHEMAHRMCIASERDANFAGFLAASVNADLQYRYSAYFMAYRYCFGALCSVRTPNAVSAASQIAAGVTPLLQRDMNYYDSYYDIRKSDTATKVADTTNDAYLRTSGEAAGIASYGQVCDLLVNWHIQEIVIPEIAVVEDTFDPYDETQVDLSGNVNARSA